MAMRSVGLSAPARAAAPARLRCRAPRASCARAPAIASAKRATHMAAPTRPPRGARTQRIVAFLSRRTAGRWSAVEVARIGSRDSVRTRA